VTVTISVLTIFPPFQHHSDHWAYHHGLLDAGDSKDVHAHIHEHIHENKREEEELPDEAIAKRGLLGDVGDAVRPLLAPLEIIPGFVSIEKVSKILLRCRKGIP
jgi:hypothetical protein